MTVGLFMLVTAPKYENAQSYAITTVLIGVLHLFCLLYVVQQSWGPSVRLPPGFEHLRDDFDSVGGGGIPWHEFNSRIPGSAITMSGFIHSGRLPRGTIGWIHFMLPLLELARWVFLLLTLRAVARIARDYDSERTATMLMFVVPGLVFGSAIMFIIIGEIGRAAGAGSGFHYVFHVLILAMTAGVAGVCALTGIACKSTKDAIG